MTIKGTFNDGEGATAEIKGTFNDDKRDIEKYFSFFLFTCFWICDNMKLKKGIFMKKYYDISGVLLSPYQPDICRGNGKHKNIECCCDNCAFQIGCLLLDKDTSADLIYELNRLGYTADQIKIDDWKENKKPKKYNLKKLVERARKNGKKRTFDKGMLFSCKVK